MSFLDLSMYIKELYVYFFQNELSDLKCSKNICLFLDLSMYIKELYIYFLQNELLVLKCNKNIYVCCHAFFWFLSKRYSLIINSFFILTL